MSSHQRPVIRINRGAEFSCKSQSQTMTMSAPSSSELSITGACKEILEKCLAGTLQKEFKHGVKAVLTALQRTFSPKILQFSLHTTERTAFSRFWKEKKYTKNFLIFFPFSFPPSYISIPAHSDTHDSSCLLFSGFVFNLWREKEGLHCQGKNHQVYLQGPRSTPRNTSQETAKLSDWLFSAAPKLKVASGHSGHTN